MNDEGRIQVPDALPAEPRLRSVIARLLRPSPAERFASARDVRNAMVGPGATATHALVARPARQSLQVSDRTVERTFALPSTPRELKGPTKELMKDATPTTLRLLYASEKATAAEDWGVFDMLSLAFFSIITAGILPITYVSMARARRRRMRRFFRDGVPGFAEVIKTEIQGLPFDEKIARVTYQFDVEGQLKRDSDTVLPAIADRWQPGDRVPILYLPDRDFDSVIIAVE
jgi:hypothetical protein